MRKSMSGRWDLNTNSQLWSWLRLTWTAASRISSGDTFVILGASLCTHRSHPAGQFYQSGKVFHFPHGMQHPLPFQLLNTFLYSLQESKSGQRSVHVWMWFTLWVESSEVKIVGAQNLQDSQEKSRKQITQHLTELPNFRFFFTFCVISMWNLFPALRHVSQKSGTNPCDLEKI